MKLLDLVNIYIEFKRSIGMRFGSQPRVLRRFCRIMGDIDVSEVRPGAVETFLYNNKPLTNPWYLNFKLLHGLCRFASSRGFAATSPLPTVLPPPLPSFRPHIYSVKELTALLAATPVLRSIRNPLQVVTFRTLQLLLYSTGMRIGEALSLTLQDVDLRSRLLTVRDSKFFKTRLFQSALD
jgi:integrase/recombinase XerD